MRPQRVTKKKLDYSDLQSDPKPYTKVKTIQKGKKNKKTKFLQYKPKQGDEKKQWQIEDIIDSRVVFRIKQGPKQDSQINSQISKQKKNVIKVKQYLINWKQQKGKQGLWPSTWEPEQNIPQIIRLEYLLNERNKIKQKRQIFLKPNQTKQNFLRHCELSMRKQNISNSKSNKKERIKYVNDQLKKGNKIIKANSSQHYKNWYKSYSQKIEGYHQLIQKKLKNEVNLNSSRVELKTPSKLKGKKQENIKKQFLHQKQVQNQRIQQSIASDSVISYTQQYMPEILSNQFVKFAQYHGSVDEVDFFKVQTFDQKISYISQQNFIRYFPFVYQKILKKRTVQSIIQAKDCLCTISFQQNNSSLRFMQRYINNLRRNISLSESIYNPSLIQFNLSSLIQGFDNTQTTNQEKKNQYKRNQREKSDVCSNNKIIDQLLQNSQTDSKEKQTKQLQIYSKTYQKIMAGKKKILNQIDLFFFSIKFQSDNSSNFSKINDRIEEIQDSQKKFSFHFLSCKQIFETLNKSCFKQSNKAINELQKIKFQKKKQNKQRKKLQSIKKIQESIIKKLSTQIKIQNTQQKQIQSLKNINLIQKSSKNNFMKENFSQKIISISSQAQMPSSQNEISSILNMISESSQHEQDVYDSEDQQN